MGVKRYKIDEFKSLQKTVRELERRTIILDMTVLTILGILAIQAIIG